MLIFYSINPLVFIYSTTSLLLLIYVHCYSFILMLNKFIQRGYIYWVEITDLLYIAEAMFIN